jgi:uncharacterized protein YbjT (DUF2867 family)
MAKAQTGIFLTGGSGFVGRNLIQHLVLDRNSPYKVTAIYRSEAAKEAMSLLTLGAAAARLTLVEADIFQVEAMQEAMKASGLPSTAFDGYNNTGLQS